MLLGHTNRSVSLSRESQRDCARLSTFKTDPWLPTGRGGGKKGLCFARLVFLTCRRPFALHDSNLHPNRAMQCHNTVFSVHGVARILEFIIFFSALSPPHPGSNSVFIAGRALYCAQKDKHHKEQTKWLATADYPHEKGTCITTCLKFDSGKTPTRTCIKNNNADFLNLDC